MEKEKIIYVPIKTLLVPLCYRNFHCLAGKCRDTCCENWVVSFNKKDYLKLRRMEAPEPLKTRLENCVHRIRGDQFFYAKFTMNEDGVCPLHDEDGLCALQRICGADALPFVCTSFPRQTNYTPAGKEYAMSLGCEAVLELLWDTPEGIDFLEEPLPAQERRSYRIDTEKSPLLRWFAPVRSLCVDILQNRALTLAQRLLLLGLALQSLEDEGDVEAWISRFAPLSRGDGASTLLEPLHGDLKLFISQNIVTAYSLPKEYAWTRKLLDNIGVAAKEKGNHSFDWRSYAERRELLAKVLPELDAFFENLMVAVLWQLAFPDLKGKETAWKSYVNFCNLYSFFRFAAAAGFDKAEPKESVIHILVMASRALLHDKSCESTLRDGFFRHNSSTLAHMAILVGE